jgi:hypothetical protein
MVLMTVTLLVAAMWSGAAIYVPLVEHPARGALDPRGQLIQWKPSYTRGAIMQAGLAVAAGVLGIVTGLADGDALWVAGGVFMLAAIPYTFAVMWKLNGRLKATPLDQAGPGSTARLERWGRLHLGRMALGLIATALYTVALAAH